MHKMNELPDGDLSVRDPWTGERMISHRFVNTGSGLHIVWTCANCGMNRDD